MLFRSNMIRLDGDSGMVFHIFAQFAEVVLEERLHELCCEHLRRWDLIRFGKLGEYMKDHAGVTIQPYHVLYPIPQAAVDANDAITENNEGY